MPQSIPETSQQGVASATAAGSQASPESGALADAPGQPDAPLSPEAVPADLDAALQNLANGVASDLGLSVKAIRLLSHRLPLTVQVLVQRADGLDVSLDECARFSGPLGEALEASGLLSLAYVLEVSSPGIGEVLASDRDFTSFRGFPVEVQHHADGSAEQVRQGLLLGRDERMLLLNMRGRTVRIPREEVLCVRLICPTDDS